MDFKIKIFCDFVLRNDFKLFVLPNIGHWGEKEQYIQFCKYFLQNTSAFSPPKIYRRLNLALFSGRFGSTNLFCCCFHV